MTRVVEQIRRKHEDFLERKKDVKSSQEAQSLIEEIGRFVKEIGEAGAQMQNRYLRSQLSAILRFWEDYIYEQTGKLPKVDLEPAKLSKLPGLLIGMWKAISTPGKIILPGVVLVLLIILALEGLGLFQRTPTPTPGFTVTPTPTFTSTPTVTPIPAPLSVGLACNPADGATLEYNDSAILHVVGPDTFIYEWAAVRGTISPTNAIEVTYTAPDKPGADVVSVKVSTDSQSVVRSCIYYITAPLPPARYDWESCTSEGAVAETYKDSRGIESVEGSSDVARTGSCSLRLNARLQGQHPDLSKGEVSVELPAPVALNDVPISCWVYVPDSDAAGPESAPNGAQLFVRDSSFKSEYGSWISFGESGWHRVTLTPMTSAPPGGGYMVSGFDPTAILVVGVKIGTKDQTPADYSYNGPFYVDACNW